MGDAIYVSATSLTPSEPYDSWANAATNVEDALAIACDGCTVVISNGTYDIAAQQQIVRGITVRGLTGNAQDVTLRAKANSGSHRLLWLNHPDAKLLDLTLRDAYAQANGGAVYIDVNGGTVRRCRFINCKADGLHAARGGGVFVEAGSANGLVESCVFTGCVSHNAGYGSAICLASGLAYNCIVTNNSSYTPVRVEGGTFANSIVLNNLNCPNCSGVYAVDKSNSEVINCVIAGNTTKSTAENACWSGNGTYFKNCLMDIASPLPESCVTEAPSDTFRDYAVGDYRLQATSQGVDGGVKRDWMTSARDYFGRPRKMGRLPDCGIYETGAGFKLIVR